MRLTQKKIEEILVEIITVDGLPLIRQLQGKDNISEFELAMKIKKDIKVVRKMLYFLYNNNLVGFTRKKDKEKGWYIYYWTLLPESIKYIYVKKRKDRLEKLKQQLEEEHKELFFVCPKRCSRLNFDQAMDFEFHCPECGELVTQDNSQKTVEELNKVIKEIEGELKQFGFKTIKKKPIKTVIKKKKGKLKKKK